MQGRDIDLGRDIALALGGAQRIDQGDQQQRCHGPAGKDQDMHARAVSIEVQHRTHGFAQGRHRQELVQEREDLRQHVDRHSHIGGRLAQHHEQEHARDDSHGTEDAGQQQLACAHGEDTQGQGAPRWQDGGCVEHAEDRAADQDAQSREQDRPSAQQRQRPAAPQQLGGVRVGQRPRHVAGGNHRGGQQHGAHAHGIILRKRLQVLGHQLKTLFQDHRREHGLDGRRC